MQRMKIDREEGKNVSSLANARSMLANRQQQ